MVLIHVDGILHILSPINGIWGYFARLTAMAFKLKLINNFESRTKACFVLKYKINVPTSFSHTILKNKLPSFFFNKPQVGYDLFIFCIYNMKTSPLEFKSDVDSVGNDIAYNYVIEVQQTLNATRNFSTKVCFT